MLNFEQALERISEGYYIKPDQIQPEALEKKVWVSEWHLPGCLSESQVYTTNKDDAIKAACQMAETEDGPPRGLAAALRRYGRADSQSPMYGLVVNTVRQLRLSDLI